MSVNRSPQKFRNISSGSQPQKENIQSNNKSNNRGSENQNKFGQTYTKVDSASGSSDWRCGGCGEVSGGSEDGIQCDQCNLWYQVKCAGISIKTYSQLAKLDSFEWTCLKCKEEIKKLKEENAIIKHENMNIKHMNDKLLEENDLLKNKLSALEKRLEEIKIELKGDIVTEVMDKIKENEDRKTREGNLVLYNIPEPSATQSNERINEDGMFCEKLFIEGCLVKREDFSIKNVIRLGKKHDNVKPRPLLVKLQSSREKWYILKNAKNLGKSKEPNVKKISITPDLTLQERELDRKLRQELKIKKENGDSNWYIKNGKLQKKNFHREH